jgi:hypothetical protein
LARDWPGRVTEHELIAVIGLRAGEVRRILGKIAPAGRGTKRWYRWRDVLSVLDKGQLARARDRERRLRLRPHGSKYWIAGYPDLVAQWHPTRNVGVWPDEVRYAARRVIWWKCPKGPDHEWRASATARTTGSKRGVTRCPFCIHRLVSVTNSLATRDPKVAEEWHPKKNGALRPKDVLFCSTRMHWWKCPKGPDHEWQAITTNRTRAFKRAGCPFCAGQRASVTNSLATRAPRAARDWYAERNGKLTPRNVPVGSRRTVWWKCSKDARHVWRSEVRTRALRTKGCPFCGHRRMWPGISLATVAPSVAKQWHRTKNGKLRPQDVIAGSSRRVWWKCPKGPDHEWYAHVWSRTRAIAPVGCPFCSGLRASVTNSLAALAPRLARQWHPTKNGSLRPKDVTLGSQRRVWWKCPKGRDHVWSTHVHSRTRSPGRCPFCVGRRPSMTQSPEKRASVVLRW